MNRYLILTLGKYNPIELKFLIRDTPITKAWLKCMEIRDKWPIDDRERFYGFGTISEEEEKAKNFILKCTSEINSYSKLITRPFTSVYDQDYLNYLHHIFEIYHGLLDQQDHDFWKCAPDNVRRALADLNLAVHRAESITRKNPTRLVCTWFGMPKNNKFDIDTLDKYGETLIKFGTVYLNYVEIGKTLENLTKDNDKYIDNNGFQPFKHYSADFFISFYNDDLSSNIPSMKKYLNEHAEFFKLYEIDSINHPWAKPTRYPVADLVTSIENKELIELLKSRQYVSKVEIIYETSTINN